MKVTFFVSGIPVPQGSMRAWNGRVTSANPNLKSWRQEVTHEASQIEARFEGPIYLSVTFYFPRPKSRKKDRFHQTKPDLDKLVRSICDSLTNSRLIRDDALVSRIVTEKKYADDDQQFGAEIEVGDRDHD